MKKNNDSKPYIFQVSTKPNILSYKWLGQELSLLSTIILWTIWLCRFLSLYQHLKALRRIIRNKRANNGPKGNKITNKSGRPDIPPIFGEIYFILWTTFFSLLHIFDWNGIIFRYLTIYYLFETTVWIFYYTVFRRFFELGYSIYHKLEYLVQILLILPTQALCYANLYDKTFREMIIGLLGAATDDTPFPVVLLGCLFAAIVISMIISTFPMETIKKPDTHPCAYVIGCGDVVQNRLYPALKNFISKEKIFIYDLNSAKTQVDYCSYLSDPNEICQRINATVKENDVIWIETPSYAHISYLDALLNSKAKLIVLEKPISIYREELEKVEAYIKDHNKRNKIFFLSYYTLEKALPLFYLTHLNERHEKYLNIEDVSLIKNWRFLLGPLQSAKVHIYEGEDDRNWVYNQEHGGQLLETFLHNVLIASLVCGQPQIWTDVNYDETLTEGKINKFSLTAKCGQATIDLYLKKNANPEELCRYAEFSFTNGNIKVDFDTKSATVYFKSLDKSSTVSIKDDFDLRYSVMADMVNRVAEDNCFSYEIDGLLNQISTIKWLLNLKENQ